MTKTRSGTRRLRILVYGLNFSPEVTGVGKYTGDMVRYLASEQGHEVRVVTAYPYYPEWRVADGYRYWRFTRESQLGATILRCPLWVPRRPTTLRRLLHLASFALSSLLPLLREAWHFRPDIVWTVEPTSFGAPGALLAARLGNAQSWLHIQDVELAAATSLGMFARRVQQLAGGMYARIVRAFDRVSTISETMRRELAALAGRPVEAIDIFPNWVDTAHIYPLPEGANPLKRELGLDDGRLICLYSGNMGEKHGVESLAAAARLLRDREDIRFVFCGAGAARDRVAALTADLPNVVMFPLQPEARLNELLNLADIHLLPQRRDTTTYAMPSKLGPMMASGQAIVAQVGAGTELAEALGKAALLVPPDDAAATADAIMCFAGDRGRRLAAGRALRKLAENLDRQHNLAALAACAMTTTTMNATGVRWAETPA